MAQEEIFPSRRREKSYFMALTGKEFKMKISRRMIALILVFAFVFVFMAMSASAATPRAACPKCGSNQAYPSSTILADEYTQYVGGCQSHTFSHQHLHRKYEEYVLCRSCGKSSLIRTYWTTTCVL